MSCIIAGIINTKTGEITDTVTRPKEKTALRLKVRDELNVLHGRDAFLVFELSLSLPNVTYIRKKMRYENTLALETLDFRYKAEQAKLAVPRAEAALTLVNDVLNECAANYHDHPAKLEIIQTCLEDEIVEASEQVSSAKYRVNHLTNRLRELESQV